VEEVIGLKDKIFVPSKQGDSPQGGSTGHTHLLHKCFSYFECLMFEDKFTNAKILVGSLRK
jgi:hypothetical protein